MKLIGNITDITKKSGIYKITCLGNNRFYIGSSNNLKQRYADHRSDLSLDNHTSIRMQRSWHKYGNKAFTFEVLELCPLDQLKDIEQWYLDTYKPYDKYIGFNTCSIAGSNVGLIMSEEARDKIRQKALGRPKSEKTIELFKAAWKENHTKWTQDSIATRGIEFSLKSPTGEIITTKGIRSFSRQYGLDHSQVRRVLDGKSFEVKGWTLPNYCAPADSKVFDPTGKEFSIPYKQITAFAKQHGLNACLLAALIKGKHSHHKCWTANPQS